MSPAPSLPSCWPEADLTLSRSPAILVSAPSILPPRHTSRVVLLCVSRNYFQGFPELSLFPCDLSEHSMSLQDSRYSLRGVTGILSLPYKL